MTSVRPADAQNFPPFAPFNPSWSSVSVLPNPRDSRRVEVRASFRWGEPSEEAARTSVGFPSNAALEIELHFRERGYLMPRGGRDWHTDPAVVGVVHNLPGYVYVDVWNYAVPGDSVVGRAQAGRSVFAECFGLETVLVGGLQRLAGMPLPSAYRSAAAWTGAAAAFIHRVPEDPDANFSVGVIDASTLIRGKTYEIYYPLYVGDSSIYSTTPRDAGNRSAPERDSSQFALRFQRIRNTCTFSPALRIPVATTACPFFIGGDVGVCDEARDQAPDREYVGTVMGRLCAPTGDVSARPATDADVRGMGFLADPPVCVDGDEDGYFAIGSGATRAYGTRVSDCDDRQSSVHPGSAETACGDLVDNDCDRAVDCRDSDCRLQCPFVCTSAAQCDDGDACNGSEYCAAGNCRHSLPSACDRGERCEPSLGCVACVPDTAPRACYTGPSGTEGVGRCRGGTQRCAPGGRWGTCAGQVLPARDEVCGNSLDDDCNGSVDDGCATCSAERSVACYSGPASTRGVGVCGDGVQDCTAGRPGACRSEILPQRENCLDGIDNDCDGRADCLDSECCGPSYCARVGCGASTPSTGADAGMNLDVGPSTSVDAALDATVVTQDVRDAGVVVPLDAGVPPDRPQDVPPPLDAGTTCISPSVRCGSSCVDPQTDVANCGGCGLRCSLPNAISATCSAGRCVIATCATLYGDCDGNPATGCEADLSAAVAHCGRCDLSCRVDQFCRDGRCVDPPPVEVCDGRDNDSDGVIDDLESCWSPVYRFWDAAHRSRCYATTPDTSGGCAGFAREFNESSGVVYGPVFFLAREPIPGTVALIPFDNGPDHILTRQDDSGAIDELTRAMYARRAPLGYIWSDVSSPPPGTFYRPAEAATALVQPLRRYSRDGVHLYANNPAETAPGWANEGVRGYVWGSRW
ncbi:MAG: hypothetical protein EPO40_01740 [Myxococcaceae bacterium]|nr:MAG: hypothetical protein EPO40_01740 [Myxococcaceae bacterium]